MSRFSPSARQEHGDLPGVAFRFGQAVATGLAGGCADVVFERALIHHLPDLAGAAAEAARLLRPRGVVLVQDRTPDDVAQPGSATHPRGWFFDVFLRLLEVENARRAPVPVVTAALAGAGFGEITTVSHWEVRRRYADRADYLAEIAQRTGRSLLHELTGAELAHLGDELGRRLPQGALVEQDRWTLWRGVRQP